MRGGGTIGLAWAGLALLPREAAAETPKEAAFSWRAPPECPQASSFSAEVERLLGQTLDARRDQRLQILGEVAAAPGGDFTVQLRVTSQHGTQRRELTHRDCAQLTEAAALVTALAIDPQLVVPESKRAPEPQPEPEPPVEAVAPAPPPVNAPPPPKPLFTVTPVAHASPSDRDSRGSSSGGPLHASIAALGLVGSAVLPGVGIGVGARGDLGPRRFRVAVDGAYWLPRFQAIGAQSGPGIELGAWGLGVKACALPVVGDVSVTACLGPKLGDMYGSGNDLLENATTVHDRWASLEAALSLSIAAKSGLMTLLGLELGKTVEAPRFGIRDDGQDRSIFEAPAWTLNAFVGLGQSR